MIIYQVSELKIVEHVQVALFGYLLFHVQSSDFVSLQVRTMLFTLLSLNFIVYIMVVYFASLHVPRPVSVRRRNAKPPAPVDAYSDVPNKEKVTSQTLGSHRRHASRNNGADRNFHESVSISISNLVSFGHFHLSAVCMHSSGISYHIFGSRQKVIFSFSCNYHNYR
jgi:hypothetical protein